MNITEKLEEMLKRHPSAPFLFIGSGFSRRYLNLEDWVGLLKIFCSKIKDFGYYNSRANGDLPLTATFMATDFNEWWWRSDETADSRAAFSKQIINDSDALKYEISRYISQKTLEDAANSENGKELSIFPDINVDGVITTNWDSLLDELFPDYKIFIGQEDLLFSNPQSIGEIYKIHGSIEDPKTLILTESDYINFSKKNPYLAAKLVTIFVEHPIIFLGYSIKDPHIRDIIMSIANCLTQEKIDQFQQNLFFVQRLPNGEAPSIEKTTLHSDDLSITMTMVKVSDFSSIYSALGTIKRKIPARLLRFFKEQMYELTKNPEKEENKIAVVGIDEIEDVDGVEFVVGLGVAQRQEDYDKKVDKLVQDALAKKGYEGVSANDVFIDCISDYSRFDADELLKTAYPGYARSGRIFMPVFRYLRAVGVTTKGELDNSKYEGAKKVVHKLTSANFATTNYRKRYEKSFSKKTTTEIIETSSSIIEAVEMLAHQPDGDIDLETLKEFLNKNLGKVNRSPHATTYNKLICRYDRKKFGFDDQKF